ncbi:LOW QUALITY PROTEIN: hypothetical protein PHMEG_00025846 [Phytophthora megakarya]|uniref:Uncharacterized protein n=1 Tax=Phytophthora megakarya TaxID=4795 RepID=A0A225VCR0_9STRA|nr:LOW QUALITY PROTEIN: hypothetical protein PHMEG_00025846 [Phytophthora megakarya]
MYLWQLDKDSPCVNAIFVSVKDGKALDTLYDAKTLSISHFRSMYAALFRPWPTNVTPVTLTKDLTIQVPPIQSEPPELGKRDLKTGPRPKYIYRKAKGCN